MLGIKKNYQKQKKFSSKDHKKNNIYFPSESKNNFSNLNSREKKSMYLMDNILYTVAAL